MSAQPKLFDDGRSSSAVLSPDGIYRYELRRRWGDGPLTCWIMCNPSTADASDNDPTILRLIQFGQRWGDGGLIVVNLWPLRTSKPSNLRKHPNPDGHGDTNDVHILAAVNEAKRVMVAWGNQGEEGWRGARCAMMIHRAVRCLGTTQYGQPKHPLARGEHYVPYSFCPEPWDVPISRHPDATP